MSASTAAIPENHHRDRARAGGSNRAGGQPSGTIAALYADFNQRVRKGQVIARLDSAQFEAQLAQARANLLAAQSGARAAEASVASSEANVAAAGSNRNCASFGPVTSWI